VIALAAPEITISSTNPLLVLPDLNPEVKKLPPVEKPEGSAKHSSSSDEQEKETEKSATQDKQISRMSRLAGHLTGLNSELSISMDKGSKKLVIKILNSQTKEVIRQIPPDELIRLAETMQESNGSLLDQTV
jgi:flagellar protein FlaG